MSAATLSAVLRFAEGRTGIVFSASQEELAGGAVRRAMERVGVRDTGAFLRRVSADEAACDALLEEVAIGETYFVREPAQLAFVRDHVVPDLVKAGAGRGLRAWSAACATGEEAYTLAALLGDAGCPDFRVLGTDLVRSRLAVAERGAYGPWSLRGVPSERADHLFERVDGRFVVRPRLRAAVDFRSLNLAGPRSAYVAAGAWAMDLIFCRNVLIYLDEATTRHVATRLMEALSPGGWLLLGASDPSLAALVPCEVVTTGAGVAYRPARPGAGRSTVTVLARPNPEFQAPERNGPVSSPWPGAPRPPRLREKGSSAPATHPAPTGAGEWATRVRALADRGDLAGAGSACSAALDRHRESPELLCLQSTLHFATRRFADAAGVAKRAVYLDREMAVAHLALGSALARTGDPRGARRAFRNAAALLRALSPGEPVAASGGETAERLLSVAEGQLAVLMESA